MAREVLTDDKCDALISHVITCSSVEHIDQTRRFVREWAAGLVPAASAEQSERWVSVTERLPENDRPVFFWVSDWLPSATPGVGPFVNDERGQYWSDETQMLGPDGDEPKRYYTKGANARGVTHWRPLPAPPPVGGEANG